MIIEYRSSNPAHCFELREGRVLSQKEAESRMIALGCPPELASRAARSHEGRLARRNSEDRSTTKPTTTSATEAGLADLDKVRDTVARWRYEEIGQLIATEDK